MSAPQLSGFKLDPLLASLRNAPKVYLVGGAVRDLLLGRQVSEHDWVVVGASVEDMIHAGFTPVGSDFPVFLHPETKDEYALARTERKSGKGYKGFVFQADPSVTLEQDLKRRDFTMNAMAMSETGDLIDPYCGRDDLLNKQFRHVSEAFSEDPLRVLRLARFLARYTDFTVADETLALCRHLVASGELAELVAERVYAEMNKAFSEPRPSRTLGFLAQIEAWPSLIGVAFNESEEGEINALIDQCLKAEQRWVLWLSRCVLRCVKQSLPDEMSHIFSMLESRIRFPKPVREAAEVYLRLSHELEANLMDKPMPLQAAQLADLLSRVDVYRKPERLKEALELLEMAQIGLAGHSWVAVMKQFAGYQLDGSFKLGLRQHLQNIQSGNIQSAVAAYRTKQIEALLRN